MSWYRAGSSSSTYSSSELSSPPPLSPVQHASNARILSYSPVLEAERGIQHTFDFEEIDSLFHHQTTFAKPPQPVKLPSFRSLFADFTTEISASVISSEPPTEPIDPAALSPESDEDDDVFDTDDSDDAGLDLLLNKYYQVSSERGRWKTEPLPFLFQRQRINSLPEPFPSHQSSYPPSRLNSEPAEAHSTATQGMLLQSDDGHIVHERSGLTQSPSPLPPSSPPLSPVSSFVSPGLGPVSPLSLSSPTFLPTSPIIPEECPPLDSDLVLEDIAPMTQTPKEDSVSFSDPTPVISHHTQGLPIQPRENEMTNALTLSMETQKERCFEDDDDAAATVLREGSVIATSASCSDLKPSSSDRDDEDRMVDEPSLNQTVADDDSIDTAPEPCNATKRKSEDGRGGPRKKRRVEVLVSRRTVPKKKVPRRRGKGWVIESESEDDSDEGESPKSVPSSLPPQPPLPLEPEDPNFEITGMLIEALATSRASSLPISSLYKSIIESRPSLKSQRTKREWCDVLLKVLTRRSAGRGVFGRVESSGKDETDKPLESQWFYIPENDWDQDRATLIRSMLPRPAKRNETKKYKQYYYRPLSKVSRWDAEEDL